MTPQDSARVLSALHGAFPHVEIDDSVVAIWANGLATSEYRHAMAAVSEWVQTSSWWPTIAEFNGVMRRIRDNDPSTAPAITPAVAPVDLAAAAVAFQRGYRRARIAVGDHPDQIDAKAAGYLSRFPESVPGVR